MEPKQTTRTTADKFAPTYPNSSECYVQPSSVVIQSPTQHQTRLFEPTANDAECKKITPIMDQQQRNRHSDADGSLTVDTKIDAESGNGTQNSEEKSKEEVAILSTEKSSNFSKTATISTVSDVAGDTNRYAIFYFYSLLFSILFKYNFLTIEFLKSEFSCVTFNYVGIVNIRVHSTIIYINVFIRSESGFHNVKLLMLPNK